jgi:selenocysteine-specific elongation factor
MTTAPGLLTVAVIGHVDHGKTALVRALTGMDTDRLPEERERGMSIALGFAWRAYDRGVIDLIDAPGHEDFVRTMVTGAAGARAALLVVSATEGFGRQTWEHLRIAELLGIQAGVVAVTKADLLTADSQAVLRAEIALQLGGTVLERAAVVFCSAVSGMGIATLHQQLEALIQVDAGPTPPPAAFLPIDRVFTLPGAGTIVTGTLQGGPLMPGDEVVLAPAGRRVGLRSLHAHGAAVHRAEPGGRVAVGLRGVSVGEVRTGAVLCAPGMFVASDQVDVMIKVSSDAARGVKHMDDLRVLWGARSDVATARLFGVKAIAPGERGLAQLRFPSAVIAHAGQRAVLRRLSPAETIGGAVVIDPAAEPSRGPASTRRVVLEAAMTGDAGLIAQALAAGGTGVVSTAEVARLARRPPTEVAASLIGTFEALDADRQATRETVAAARGAYLAAVDAAHRAAPARAAAAAGAIRAVLGGVAAREVIGHVERALAAEGAIRMDGALVALAGHDPFAALSAEGSARVEAIEAALRDGGARPPDVAAGEGAVEGLEGNDEALVRLLIDTGRAVSLRNVGLRQTLVFHRDAVAAAVTTLREAFPWATPFTTGEARAALGTSRKFIVPLLEHLDTLGETVRDGDVRRVAV